MLFFSIWICWLLVGYVIYDLEILFCILTESWDLPFIWTGKHQFKYYEGSTSTPNICHVVVKLNLQTFVVNASKCIVVEKAFKFHVSNFMCPEFFESSGFKWIGTYIDLICRLLDRLLAHTTGSMVGRVLVFTGFNKLVMKFGSTKLLNSYLNALGSQSLMTVSRFVFLFIVQCFLHIKSPMTLLEGNLQKSL